MSKDAAQARFEEAWFEEHDIMGKLEDVQYDELLLQYFNDYPAIFEQWLSENPQPRLCSNGKNPIEDMPQSIYRELITWYRSSQLRVDSYYKWLETRLPEMPDDGPEFEHE